MRKPERLERIESIDIPVVEASGIASRTGVDGTRQVLVVGDRTSEVAVGTIGDGGAITWTVLDLAEVEGWPVMLGDSQFESIAADDGSLVAIMREDPPVVFVADAPQRRLVCRIVLDDRPALVGMWDEANSRGEGMALLRGGRLLVAKEKHPAALVEFAPAGVAAQGVGSGDFLGPAERWQAPSGDVTYSAVAVWELAGDAAESFRDISAIGKTAAGDLWLLSDKSRTVGRLRLDPPLSPEGGQIVRIDEVWRLPKHTHKPEGLATLGPGRFLVCLDTDSTVDNGLVIAPPSHSADHSV